LSVVDMTSLSAFSVYSVARQPTLGKRVNKLKTRKRYTWSMMLHIINNSDYSDVDWRFALLDSDT
jgi:hypothetical protein